MGSRRSRAAGGAALAMSLVVLAGATLAQPPRRAGAERQTVVRLAYVLGEAHALRRLCAGPSDSTWYDRMQRLLSEEAVDDASRRQLVESFNAGFAVRQAEFPGCSPRAQAAEQTVAEQGRGLATALAGR